MEQNETGCQASQAPLLCDNNCGFFGSASTMNMCSKCYKDLVLEQEQANLAASSIQSIIVNGSSPIVEKEKVNPAVTTEAQAATSTVTLALPKTLSLVPAGSEKNEEQGPKRCVTCRKRVGLTGFTCRCGSTCCSVHRYSYSDKHDCQFDYRSAAQEAIAKANPVIKAEKIDKI